MNHHEIQDLFQDYLDESLEIELKNKVQNHLDSCLECRTALQQYRSIITLEALAAFESSEPVVDLVDDIMDQLDEELAHPPGIFAEVSGGMGFLLGTLSSMVVVLGLTLAMVLNQTTNGQERFAANQYSEEKTKYGNLLRTIDIRIPKSQVSQFKKADSRVDVLWNFHQENSRNSMPIERFVRVISARENGPDASNGVITLLVSNTAAKKIALAEEDNSLMLSRVPLNAPLKTSLNSGVRSVNSIANVPPAYDPQGRIINVSEGRPQIAVMYTSDENNGLETRHIWRNGCWTEDSTAL